MAAERGVQLNSAVEVKGLSIDGFPASWSSGKVTAVYQDGALCVKRCTIEYDDFMDVRGQKLRETFPVRSRRLRPAPPAGVQLPRLDDYEVGQAVDFREHDIWWHGVVWEQTPGTLRVFLPEVDRSMKVVRRPEQVRLSMEFEAGKWVPRPPPVKAKKPAIALAAAAKAAAEATAAQEAAKAAATAASKRAGRPPKAPATAAGGARAPVAGPPVVSPSSARRTRTVASLYSADDSSGAAAADFASAANGLASVPADRGSDAQPDPLGAVGHVANGLQNGAESDSDAEAGMPADTAEPAASAAASQPSGGLVRRSGRATKSRLIMVKGVPVLRINNYDLAQGERSVFDQELSRDGGAAQGVLGEPVGGGGKWLPAPPQAPRSGSAGPRAAPVQSALDIARKAHNEAVRADAKAAEFRRARYFLGHLPVLQRFITPAVAARISATAALAPADEARPPAVEFQPEGVTGGEMREYQLAGLRWLVDRFDDGVNAILADEMGLGKTLQTVAFLSYLKDERGLAGPSLVVVPLSVMSSWCAELARWAPGLRVVRLHTNDDGERKRMRQEVLGDPSKFDVAITTYDMMLSAKLGTALARTITWRVLVLDEGHKIKNEHTAIAHAMRHVAHQHIVLLTGTPLQNNLHELYALLSYLHPEVFTDAAPFDDAFDLTRHKVDNEVLEAAHELMRPLSLRRLKEHVETSLPPRVETRITCPLSAMQTFWYRRLLLKDSKMLAAIEAEHQSVEYEKDNNTWKKLQALIVQLRKCCNHPYLFPGAEPFFDGTTTGEDVVEAAGKMGVLDRLLERLRGRGHRVTLFSQYNRMLDIIEDFLIMRGYKYLRLDGSTNRVQRMIDIAQFQAPGSDVFIYILNTRAGGLGVNLQTADTCILYDSDWNPQWDLQAMARVHRIGQTRPVHVYRFCTAGTVEERVQLRAEKKLFLDQMVNRGGVQDAEELASLSKKELLSMLRFGADRIFNTAEGRPPSDAELDAIIDRSHSRATAADGNDGKAEPGNSGSDGLANGVDAAASIANGAMANGIHALGSLTAADDQKHSAADFDAEALPLSSFILNGQDYSKERSLKDIATEFWVGAQRERKQRLVTIGRHQVLRENNYDLASGEPSVFNSETARDGMAEPTGRRSTRQIAGTDYQHAETCQICWDGGELVCCSECPASYHPECLGHSLQDLEGMMKWTCPHHTCSVCHRNTSAAGGLLFRCEVCANAFCEDHMPGEAHLVVKCARFQALGQIQPKQACFIHCSQQCRALATRMPEEMCTPQPEADGVAAKAEPLSNSRSPGKSGKRKAAAAASGPTGAAAQGSKLPATTPPVKKQRGGGSGHSGGQASSVKAEVKAEAKPADLAVAAQAADDAAAVPNGVPLPAQPGSLAARARALLQADAPAQPVTCSAASAATSAAVAASAAAPLPDDPRRPTKGGLPARREACVLAALDAAPPDPAAGGRPVISLFKLRAHLAALPDSALADFATSKDDQGRLQLPAAINRLAAAGSASWRSHQKMAVQRLQDPKP